MRQDVTHVNLRSIEMDRSDEPVFVTGDVEHHESVYLVGARECLPQPCEGGIR